MDFEDIEDKIGAEDLKKYFDVDKTFIKNVYIDTKKKKIIIDRVIYDDKDNDVLKIIYKGLKLYKCENNKEDFNLVIML